MAKDIRFQNEQDAAQRFHNTILRYKGLPVILTQYDGFKYRRSFLDPADAKRFADEDEAAKKANPYGVFLVDANSKDIDVESPPTGYVNFYKDQTSQVLYLSRLPIRRYTQGLTPSNVSLVNDFTGENVLAGERGWPIPTKFIGAMIKGDYPDAAKCLAQLEENEDSEGLAFTRKLAFVRSANNPEVIQLRFQSQTVGFVKRDKVPTVSLLPDWAAYNILKSSLMNAGVFV